jgi:hypothetical protein
MLGDGGLWLLYGGYDGMVVGEIAVSRGIVV